ncbi:MAG: sulfatase-like hydrolase/transferase [Candidatus Pacebacteria bacterium]|nr:sulfatase-like hydrolase/transferase [Candidatus Paceibacterota bacterium]
MTSNRPNILRIVSDDTSEEMLGYSGGNVLTPNIDSIAGNGVVFDNFHCPSTVCMASRYAALTGHYCGRCPAESFRRQCDGQTPYSVAFNTDIMPGRDKTIGHVLQGAGYRTGYVGKWHTGPKEEELGTRWFAKDDDPRDPAIAAKLEEHQEALCEQVRRNGFDYAGGISWGNPQPGDRQIEELEVHNLEWMTKAALDFVDATAREGTPFFLNYAVTTIHGNGHIESLLADPRLTPAGYREDHLGCMPDRPSIYTRIVEAGLPFNFVTSGALWMDDAIGALLERLRKLHVLENTIVIYSSDHGACEDKATVYQGGTRIPCVLQWRQSVPPARHVTALTQNIDWVPTLAAAAGTPIPDGMALDGRNILPLLTGETCEVPDRDDLYFEHGYARAVRTARWKYMAYRLPQGLIDTMHAGDCERACNPNGSFNDVAKCLSVERHPDFFDPDQLYDLAADPGERYNLADDPAYAEVLEEMRQRLRRYLDTFDQPFPIDQRQAFIYTQEFARLTEPYRSLDALHDLRWWRRRWHHRPHEVKYNFPRDPRGSVAECR